MENEKLDKLGYKFDHLIIVITEFNVSMRAFPCKVQNFDNQKL